MDNILMLAPTAQAEEEMYDALLAFRSAQREEEGPEVLQILHSNLLFLKKRVDTLEMARLNYPLN